MIQVIFSDIDGTLLNKEHQVTPRTRNALIQVVNCGVDFVPVSARMPSAIRTVTDPIDISGAVIAYNGALILGKDDEILESTVIDTVQLQSIYEFIRKETLDLAWNIYVEDKWYVRNRQDFWIEREEDIVAVTATELDEAEVKLLDYAHKVLLMGKADEVMRACDIMKQRFPVLSIMPSGPHLLEIMAAGVNKGRAIVSYMQKMDIQPSKSLAFGDNFNDVEMLRQAGRGILMGNAPQVLQEEFADITSDHNHDGIANALEDLGVI